MTEVYVCVDIRSPTEIFQLRKFEKQNVFSFSNLEELIQTYRVQEKSVSFSNDTLFSCLN